MQIKPELSSSERHAEGGAQAPLLGAGIVVVHAMDILDMDELEDVVDAHDEFDVGFVALHDVGEIVVLSVLELSGEVHEQGVALVLGQEGVVLVREGAPEGVDADVFAPLEFLDEGDAVEELAVHVPRDHGRGVAVVEELHVVDEVEGVVLEDVGEVGRGHDEEGIGHLVPLYAALEHAVDFAPGVEPEALVEGGLGEVVVVLASQDALDADGVADAHDRGVEVGGQAALLGVDVGGSGLIAQADGGLGKGYLPEHLALGIGGPAAEVVEESVGEGLIEHGSGSLVPLATQLHVESHAVFPLPVVEEIEALEIVHVAHLGPLPGHKDVVLVGGQVFVAGGDDVVGVGEGEVVDGIFAGQIVLLVEGVGELAHALPAFVAEAVLHVAAGKPVGAEVGGGLCRGAQAEAFDPVAANHGVDGADVHLAGVFGIDGGLYKVLDEGLGHPDDVFHALDVLHLLEQDVHLALALREGGGTEFLPELVVAHLGRTFLLHVATNLERAFGDGREVEVLVAHGALDLEFLYEGGELELDNHLVVGDHTFARRQGLEVLHDVHVLDEVDVAARGYAEMGTLELPRGVGQHIERARETEVLGVVGREIDLIAHLLIDQQGVGEVVAVEVDGLLGADGADEGELQEAHVFLIDIDIGEAVGQHGGDDVARVDEVGDALVALAEDDGLLGLGVATIDLLTHLLLYGQGEDEFARLGADLDVILQEGEVLEVVVLKDLLGELVEGEGHLLVLLVGEEVALIEVAHLLGLYHLAHHVHGGIVLAAVLALLLGDDHFLHGIVALDELDVNLLRTGLLDGDGIGVVAYHGELEGALAGLDAVLAIDVGDGQGALALGILDAHAGHGLAILLIDDGACDELRCCPHGDEQEQGGYGYSVSQCLNLFRLHHTITSSLYHFSPPKNSSAFRMSPAWSTSRILESGRAFSLSPSATRARWKLRMRLWPCSMQ